VASLTRRRTRVGLTAVIVLVLLVLTISVTHRAHLFLGARGTCTCDRGQLDQLLKPKLASSGLQQYVEVTASISGETERWLLPVYNV
jgi:hypothetical protein